MEKCPVQQCQILYRVLSHVTRSAVKVQGQEVRGQGYSVTTYQHKKRCNSGTVKRCENYPIAERNT